MKNRCIKIEKFLTYDEIISLITLRTEIPREKVRKSIAVLWRVLESHLGHNEKVIIRNFGKFQRNKKGMSLFKKRKQLKLWLLSAKKTKRKRIDEITIKIHN